MLQYNADRKKQRLRSSKRRYPWKGKRRHPWRRKRHHPWRRKRHHPWKRNRHPLRRKNHHNIQKPHQRSGLLKNQFVQPRVTRASTRSNPNTDDTYDSSITPSQLLYLTKREPRIKIMDMHEDSTHIDGEPFVSYKAFTYATSNLHGKRFSEEEKRVVQTPRTHTDAINSPEHNEWKIAIDKEMDSLKDHDVYDLVPITSVPHDNKIKGSCFVFKQKTDGRFKARLVVQGYVQEPGVATERRRHRYAESAAFA